MTSRQFLIRDLLVLFGLTGWAVALPGFGSDFVISMALTCLMYIALSSSWALFCGSTRYLSLATSAFFGIGAYTSALLSLGFDLDIGLGSPVVVDPKPVWVAFLGGIVVAALCGWLIGRLAFRVRGAYFVIVTVSFAQVIRMVALNWVDLTEGPMALNNIPPFSIWLPGTGTVPLYGKAQTYWLVLAVGVVCWCLVALVVRSRIGRALIALRENESLARSVGIGVTHYLVIATVLAAAIAGAAGGLYAHYVRIVDPDVFLFIYTVSMVIMVVTGGKGTLAGPVVGGVIFGLLPEVLREVARPEVQWIVYGVAMIAVVMFLPKGIVPAVSRLFRRRPAPVAAPVTP